MVGERVKGLAATHAFMGKVPQAAQEQLGIELAIISREILAEQQRLVPRLTSALSGALSISVMIDQLRARIGLLGSGSGKVNGRTRKTNLGAFFYGRIVNFGRNAQTVLVTRNGRKLARQLKTRGARRAAVLAKTYSMKVTALPAREFIQVPGAEDLALGQLAEFWSRVLARAGG